MSQIRVSGRPTGTDGSDFSYRMVVESRYKKVAVGKSRLSALIYSQAFVQFVAVVALFLSTPKEATLDRVSIATSVLGFLSLLIGELGRRRSRVKLLKLYLFGSSVAPLISVASILKDQKSFEIIKDLSSLETTKFQLFKMASLLLAAVYLYAVVLQVSAIGVTVSLIGNMAPPKMAS